MKIITKDSIQYIDKTPIPEKIEVRADVELSRLIGEQKILTMKLSKIASEIKELEDAGVKPATSIRPLIRPLLKGRINKKIKK
jgi:hypothetical protein